MSATQSQTEAKRQDEAERPGEQGTGPASTQRSESATSDENANNSCKIQRVMQQFRRHCPRRTSCRGRLKNKCVTLHTSQDEIAEDVSRRLSGNTLRQSQPQQQPQQGQQRVQQQQKPTEAETHAQQREQNEATAAATQALATRVARVLMGDTKDPPLPGSISTETEEQGPTTLLPRLSSTTIGHIIPRLLLHSLNTNNAAANAEHNNNNNNGNGSNNNNNDPLAIPSINSPSSESAGGTMVVGHTGGTSARALLNNRTSTIARVLSQALLDENLHSLELLEHISVSANCFNQPGDGMTSPRLSRNKNRLSFLATQVADLQLLHTSQQDDNSVYSSFKPPVAHVTKLTKFKRDNCKFLNQYRIIKELGRGECGKVKLAYDEVERRLVAIKQVRRADTKARVGGLSPAQQRYMAFLREVGIMQNLRHANIASVYEVIDDPSAPKVYLVMQYIENGPIAEIDVRDGTDEVCRPIPAAELVCMARQILTGLEYLHQRNIIHRDIKPANILVGADKQVYLVDFGVAETFDTTFRARMERRMAHSMACSMALSEAGEPAEGPVVLGTKGTLLFIAPEVWTQGRSYGKAVDMWAVGVTLYTLLTGRLPFRNPQEINDPALPAIPTSYGTRWSWLLRGMFERDPSRRLTAHQARLFVKEMEQHASSPVRRPGSARHGSIVASTHAALSSGRSCAEGRKYADSASPLLSLVDVEASDPTRMDWKLENVPADSIWSLQSRLGSQRSFSVQSGRRDENKNVVNVGGIAAASVTLAHKSNSSILTHPRNTTAAAVTHPGGTNIVTSNNSNGGGALDHRGHNNNPVTDTHTEEEEEDDEKKGGEMGDEDAGMWVRQTGVTTNMSGSTTSTSNGTEENDLTDMERIIAQMLPGQLPRMASIIVDDTVPQSSLMSLPGAAPAATSTTVGVNMNSNAPSLVQGPTQPSAKQPLAAAVEVRSEVDETASAVTGAEASGEDVLLPTAVVSLLQLHSQACARYGSPDNVPFASSSTTSHANGLVPIARATSSFALASVTRASEPPNRPSAAMLHDIQAQPSRSRNPSNEYSVLNPSSMLSAAPQSIISPQSNKGMAGQSNAVSGPAAAAAHKPSDSHSSLFDELYHLPCLALHKGSAAQEYAHLVSQMNGGTEAERMSCTHTLALNASAQGRRTATEKRLPGTGSLSPGMCDEPFEFLFTYRDRTGSNETEYNRDLAINAQRTPSMNTASRRSGLTSSPGEGPQYVWPISPSSITRGST